MKISVTQEDIDYGIPGSCLHCPVAIALERYTGDTCEVWGGGAVNLKDLSTIDLPEKVNEFIQDFDEGNPVHPLEFDIP